MGRLAEFLKKLPMPSLTSVLLGALILLQFPLWFGQGGWIRVWRLERQIEVREIENEARRQRILELEAEVRDFKSSPRAAEERARYELGLIKPGESFVQWAKPVAPPSGSLKDPPKKGDASP